MASAVLPDNSHETEVLLTLLKRLRPKLAQVYADKSHQRIARTSSTQPKCLLTRILYRTTGFILDAAEAEQLAWRFFINMKLPLTKLPRLQGASKHRTLPELICSSRVSTMRYGAGKSTFL